MTMRELRSEQEIMQNWKGDPCKPLVSICCITYNHETFIEDALEGFLIQETDFPFEILIHDDASTDKTADIIREYEAKYPNLMKPIYQVKNQYSQGIKINPSYNFPRAKGKYIALCEGDDYWTSSEKLYKQYDFLEKNVDYALCFHKVLILNDNGRIVDDFITKVPVNHESIYDLAIYGNYIHTPSVLFQNKIKNYPSTFLKSPIGDYPLYMYLSQFGKIKYLDNKMAVYRHGVGIWSIHDQYYRHYNTAICHSIIFEYFMNSSKNEIASIFANRIRIFFTYNIDKIQNKDVDRLLSSPALARFILKQIISETRHKNKIVLNKSTFKKIIVLFQNLMSRFKKYIS